MAFFSLKCRCIASTKVLKFYTDHTIPAGIRISSGVCTNVDGYRYINIFVEFHQDAANEKPVDLRVIFAFDNRGYKLVPAGYISCKFYLSHKTIEDIDEFSGKDYRNLLNL